MIYILHGEDYEASYLRLTELVKTYSDHKQISLSDRNNIEDFYLAVYSVDIFEFRKVVVCENYLTDRKVKENDLNKIVSNQKVIFWEKSLLPANYVKKYQKFAILEQFKPKPVLFWFLDSLTPQSTKAIKLLKSAIKSQQESLIWHLTNRIFQLILVKMHISLKNAALINEKKINEWQWQKLVIQSDQFNLRSLLLFYNGLLRLDYLIKTGKTAVGKETLLTMLLLKYLRN